MHNKSLNHFVDTLFKDKNGKIVVAQFPNIPLASWIFFSLIELPIKHGKAHTGLHELAQASLFVWAYLELKMGDSLFRRILGGVVLLSIALSFFM